MSFYSHIDEPELKYSAVNCNCIKDLYSLALGTYRQYIKENLILGLSKDLARLYLNRDLKSQTTDEEREKNRKLREAVVEKIIEYGIDMADILKEDFSTYVFPKFNFMWTDENIVDVEKKSASLYEEWEQEEPERYKKWGEKINLFSKKTRITGYLIGYITDIMLARLTMASAISSYIDENMNDEMKKKFLKQNIEEFIEASLASQMQIYSKIIKIVDSSGGNKQYVCRII